MSGGPVVLHVLLLLCFYQQASATSSNAGALAGALAAPEYEIGSVDYSAC